MVSQLCTYHFASNDLCAAIALFAGHRVPHFFHQRSFLHSCMACYLKVKLQFLLIKYTT